MTSPKPQETTECLAEAVHNRNVAMSAIARRAGERAVARHHREGRSVATWHDGRVMYHHPDGSITDEDQTPNWAKETSATAPRAA